jgi:uncharacterized protein (DUF486 family)
VTSQGTDSPQGLSVPWDVTSLSYLLKVDTNPCGLSVPWDVTSLDYLLQVDTNPCGLSVPWDVAGDISGN